MGLQETTTGIGLGPSAERQKFVRGEIKHALTTLLTNGGAITQSGRILSFHFDELNIGRALDTTDIKSLALKDTAAVPFHRAKALFGENRVRRNETVHVIAPNVIANFGYRLGDGGAISAVIEGRDQNRKTTEYYITKTGEVGEAIVNYVGKILSSERISGPFFQRKRYTGEILIEIAEKHGRGDISKRRY